MEGLAPISGTEQFRLTGLSREEARAAKDSLLETMSERFPNLEVAAGLKASEGRYDVAVRITDVLNDAGEKLSAYLDPTADVEWLGSITMLDARSDEDLLE